MVFSLELDKVAALQQYGFRDGNRIAVAWETMRMRSAPLAGWYGDDYFFTPRLDRK